MALLEIKNLSAGYGEFEILKHINLTLEQGSVSVLMGPNGAGKSTLLKSIFALTHIIEGDICFEHNNISNFPAYKLLDLGIAFVTQGKVNFALLSVKENLLMGAHHISDSDRIKERLEEVFVQFPVLKQKQYAFSLSGGEQQMLAIGRALMSHPTLLLMDEPSLGLAPKLVKEMFHHITTIRDTFGTTVLIVEHNIKSLLDSADYGFVLVHGKLVASDTCENLKNNTLMKQVFVGTFD